jgi:CheY-like chemotaxis protein
MLRGRNCTVPIVALTANAMESDLEQYLRIGCDDYIVKPVNRGKFLSVVGKYLKRSAVALEAVGQSETG